MQSPDWLKNDPDFANRLRDGDHLWLVTGAAGFIGSHLVETLLRAGCRVRALDNFATGYRRNLDEVSAAVGVNVAEQLDFVEADIRDFPACEAACADVTHVLHQAALGSVPRSIAEPTVSNDVNVGGFVNMIEAARRADVTSFTYAASSSTYGDSETLPKVEDHIGQPLSPYAVTKLVNEQYAKVYKRVYGFRATGLRYFNVFGPRQDPGGAYAAVIPLWTAAMIKGEDVVVNGDGETSRDFCYIANTVQANLRAALAAEEARGDVYNVALGNRTTLNELFEMIREALGRRQISYRNSPAYGPFREGDVRHSQASIDKAGESLGYIPTHGVGEGMEEAMDWYINFFRGSG